VLSGILVCNGGGKRRQKRLLERCWGGCGILVEGFCEGGGTRSQTRHPNDEWVCDWEKKTISETPE